MRPGADVFARLQRAPAGGRARLAARGCSRAAAGTDPLAVTWLQRVGNPG